MLQGADRKHRQLVRNVALTSTTDAQMPRVLDGVWIPAVVLHQQRTLHILQRIVRPVPIQLNVGGSGVICYLLANTLPSSPGRQHATWGLIDVVRVGWFSVFG